MVPARASKPEGYYGLPMLKRPLWGWEIALYFFSEGISSGSYIIAAMAELGGGDRYAPLVRRARYLAFATLLPCPPLLIADLGRPERFHHMLRVFKPHSPMNMGAWALAGFTAPVSLLALAQLFWQRPPGAGTLGKAGLPFAFFMLGYPGVLLTTTSIPLWSRSRWLGALLGASSMSAAAASLSIVGALDPATDSDTRRALHRIRTVSHIVETASFAGYLAATGSAAKPLLAGRYARMFRTGAFVGGILIPTVLAVVQRKPSRKMTVVSGLLSLAGALSLKWAMVHAGRESADDPAAARDAARATAKSSGWLNRG